MAGWNLKKGSLTLLETTEEKYWELFNFAFSESSKKRNTYKFGLIKAIIDNIFNTEEIRENSTYFLSYEQIFTKFAENYWNLITKYHLIQMRKSSVNDQSKIEKIFYTAINSNDVLSEIEFASIDVEQKKKIIKEVTNECKKNVIGALYADFEGYFYSFELKGKGIYISKGIYNFIIKYKYDIEKLNYYSWAKFLEKINDDSVLIRVIDKLELSTPRRSNLSIYKEILYKEFGQNTCFYCGKPLIKSIHVDHFIPWSFVKDDHLWNFVLSCPTCNEKKNNKIPNEKLLTSLLDRNEKIKNNENEMISIEFKEYDPFILRQLWYYSHLSGMREYDFNLK